MIDLRIGMAADGFIGKMMIVSCSVLLIPYILITTYIFPVQAKFENTIRDNFKNALLMSLQNFGYSLLLCLITGSLIFLGLFFAPVMGMMLVCGAGLFGYLTSNIFVHIFRKYLPGEIEEDAERSGINQMRE